MSGKTDTVQLMIRVARMYYIYGVNQKTIAEQLGISRGYVCQLLDKARESGVVEIKVNTLAREESELERRLCDSLGLRKTIALPLPGEVHNTDVLQSEIIDETCAYLDSIVKSGMLIAFSWGRTVYSISSRMQRHIDIRDVDAIPLCGGSSNLGRNIYVSEISTNLARAYNGTPLSIPLPAILENEEIKAAVYGDANMRHLLERTSHADIALFTVGEFSEHNSLYLGGYIGSDLLDRLQQQGAVGDLCAHFINKWGEVCDLALDRRTVSVDLRDFANIPHKICVATGEKKAAPLLGALRKGYVDVLITSEETARTILRLM